MHMQPSVYQFAAAAADTSRPSCRVPVVRVSPSVGLSAPEAPPQRARRTLLEDCTCWRLLLLLLLLLLGCCVVDIGALGKERRSQRNVERGGGKRVRSGCGAGQQRTVREASSGIKVATASSFRDMVSETSEQVCAAPQQGTAGPT